MAGRQVIRITSALAKLPDYETSCTGLKLATCTHKDVIPTDEVFCARGLEYGPRPQAQFFPIRTDLGRQITCLYFSLWKITL